MDLKNNTPNIFLERANYDLSLLGDCWVHSNYKKNKHVSRQVKKVTKTIATNSTSINLSTKSIIDVGIKILNLLKVTIVWLSICYRIKE